MRIELRCSRCSCHIPVPADVPFGRVLERLAEEGPWYALGDGETWEDRIYSCLPAAGEVRCPHCGATVEVSEDDLGELSRELLAQW